MTFQIVLVENYIVINSWKLFVMVCALMPILGFLVSVFVLSETPKYLLIQKRNEESLKVLKDVYSRNTGNSPESFPVSDCEIHFKELD